MLKYIITIALLFCVNQAYACDKHNKHEKPLAILEFQDLNPDIDKKELDRLKTLLIALKHDPQVRVNIISYAFSDNVPQSLVRRASLRRGIKLRNYLVYNSIDITRVNIQAVADDKGKSNKIEVYQMNEAGHKNEVAYNN